MTTSLALCVAALWMAACQGAEQPDYLSHSHGMGEVWAVDGDRFYVSSGGAVVLWIDGAPARVIYSPPDRYANDMDWRVQRLWGTQGELTALGTSLDLRVGGDSEFELVPEPPGQQPVFFVRGNDAWAVTSLDGTGYLLGSSRIYRLQGGIWNLEAEIGDNFIITSIGGDSDTGLWVAGNGQTQEQQSLKSTPTLLRRGAAGWETMDSTHLGYVSLGGECTDSCDNRCPGTGGLCLGDVYAITGMWVDSIGRAHVIHRGSGILVHDGAQSWIEESPDRISRVDVSPDGTVYAVAAGADDVDSAYMWIHDATGWHGSELWPDFNVQGLSAFDGGAIVSTCSYDSSGPEPAGCSLIRFWPDGTWTGLLHFPL